MPYVVLDSHGDVLYASVRPQPKAIFVGPGDPKLKAWFAKKGMDPELISKAVSELDQSDYDMIRAVEDLISALVERAVIAPTDIPGEVHKKMARRAELRKLVANAFK